MSVQPGASGPPSSETWPFSTHQFEDAGHSAGSRSPASSGAAGGYRYGSTPESWTRASQPYRYTSSLLRGPASPAATGSNRPPTRISGTAVRAGSRMTSTAPIANAAQATPSNSGARAADDHGDGRNGGSASASPTTSRHAPAAVARIGPLWTDVTAASGPRTTGPPPSTVDAPAART